MKLHTLYRWNEDPPGASAFQMALDEALFHFTRESGLPVIRYYTWESPALTFGYSEAHPHSETEEAVRRYTGGGRVEHDEDLTFLLTLPADTPAARGSAAERYRWIHEALKEALGEVGVRLFLEGDAGQHPAGPCFQTPVPSDLMAIGTGEKIGGGAQRRSRGSVIHQGSIRLARELRTNHAPWTALLERKLSEGTESFPETAKQKVIDHAEELAATRYRSPEWNHRR